MCMYLAVFAPEDEVGLATAATHLILLLVAISVIAQQHALSILVPTRTNRLTPTQLACVSLQDVHWTWNVYQKGFASESSGRRLVTLSAKC